VTGALALLASVLWGTADYQGGVLARRLPPVTVTFLSQGFALVAVAVVTVAAGGLRPPGRYLLWGVACGLVGSAALVAFYRALAVGTMGVVAPIASVGVAVPVLSGLLAGERPHPLQLVGIAVAVAGVVLAGGPELRTGEPGRGRALALALLAGAGFGSVYVLLAHGSASSVAMTLLAQRSTNLLAVGAALAALRRPPLARPAQLPPLAFVGVADVAANAAFGLASRGGPVSVVAVLASLYPVVTALLARWLLHERLRQVQLVGVAAAIGGAALIVAA
jgi:drug/metabolite transporter (DMT)-like permease